ncbi:flagellar filament capping protein FliD [Anaeroselena agilis]|uniref:Flagellar hook-associated protein 2 n=1 Tax=Anaeroselena agilis TaxID=3063788 RepID=A0ABU3NZ83_9FIRM|nr:flagellar filament capping protein FliD [Selenomonadales bacterium 4137-cl]
MSSSITTTTINGTTRITGLASGIDVDSIVEQLMAAEKEKKLNKLQQKEQLATWRQEAYREIISDLQTFTNKYFSLTSSSSLLSSKNFNQFTVSSSSSAVTASYTSAASAGSHTVTVSQLATKATLASGASLSADVQGSAAADYSDLSGKSVVLTVDGTEYTVSLDDVTDLASLQSAVDDAVGEGKVTVATTTNDSGASVLTITAADSGVQEIAVSSPDAGDSGLSALGFVAADGAVLANRLTTSTATLEDVAAYLGITFNSTDGIELTVNGTSFSFDKSTTVDELIDEINAADCGATIEYDQTSGKLVMTAATTGAGNKLTVAEGTGSDFLAKALSVATAGKDAKLTVDGQAMTRSTNTVTADGVTYTLNATTDEDATVSLIQDTDAVYDLVSSFVEDYNALIATITAEITADYDADYPPLTDDQKAEMTDEEIENWEAQAKTGLLEDDSLLRSMLSELRSAVTDSISGVSTSIFAIGIDTGSYDENGKLYIDEDALKEALQSDPDEIVKLFTQQSSSYSGTATVRKLTSAQLSTRYKEEGVAYRFYDVLAKYTSTVRDSSGSKGLLLEKAGVENDSSDTANSLSELIEDYQTALADEEDRLDDYEERLYSKYTTLETYISNMNAQLTALQSYLSSSTGS